jgi:hypothetical protein
MPLDELLIMGAGIGQLVLVVAGCCIPFVLDWRKSLAPLDPLNRQLYRTYGAYILGANMFFALICLLDPSALVSGTFLAKAFSIYLTIYWLVRLALNFVYFDRSFAPQTWWAVWGERVLLVVFTYLIGVYGYAAYTNFT